MSGSSGAAPDGPPYSELHCVSHCSFLRGGSSARELLERAERLGYEALAISDACSLAGAVRAHRAWCELRAEGAAIRLVHGVEFELDGGYRLVALAADRAAWEAISGLVTRLRAGSPPGEAAARLLDDETLANAGLDSAVLLLVPPAVPLVPEELERQGRRIARLGPHAALALERLHEAHESVNRRHLERVAGDLGLPLAAAGDVHMHARSRRALVDVLAALRHRVPLRRAGRRLHANGERHLRPRDVLGELYPAAALEAARRLGALCTFSLDELVYRYPTIPWAGARSPAAALGRLTAEGAAARYPAGVPAPIRTRIDTELELLERLGYSGYVLVCADLVREARIRGILCQGRGSAANSVVCYCLGISSVSPERTRQLFARFLSPGRDEAPDIDIDFESGRREEIIRYVYDRYGRDRAAIAAAVTTFRSRSAARELAFALDLGEPLAAALARELCGRGADGASVAERVAAAGLDPGTGDGRRFVHLFGELRGTPRHLSQHVGGFVIGADPLTRLCPVIDAAMPGRSIIEWDKDDLETLGVLKIDVLGLGMLGAIRRTLARIGPLRGRAPALESIPESPTDPAWSMIRAADTVGVFQIESRAQRAMLPRLAPRTWYDLVVQISLVRPGPIQGGMVGPYLERRAAGTEPDYPHPELRPVLERTLGVAVFQEQVLEIVMVAGGLSAGEADRFRRALGPATTDPALAERLRRQLLDRMTARGYEIGYARRIWAQVEGFGSYGFPESHAASFAILAWASAWLRCHEPAAFCAALIDEQPMGFYSVSELVADLRRRGVAVYGVDVNRSGAESLLVGADGVTPAAQLPAEDQPGLRLGLGRIRGLSARGIAAVLGARIGAGPFVSIDELRRRTGLHAGDLAALVGAGACDALEGHRHRAAWRALLPAPTKDLLAGLDVAPADAEAIRAPTLGETVVADYRRLGLSLAAHPLALLRGALAGAGVIDSLTWSALDGGAEATIAGLVMMRQRPGTAGGTLFVTLEDEHGAMEIVVDAALVSDARGPLFGARLLLARGRARRSHGRVVLDARSFERLDGLLARLEDIDAVRPESPASTSA